ncbi:uncharacterized protein LOC117282386 [Cryptotermes secundus]|uniref:uncharacterized protein LOC117282386 n=1 Tax=Cryptotermes secundus TaxID=105785 RepID=UPI001454E381|nr:uncharacterized protein LOC117282386 [Cryptotermes secundus]
MEMQQVIEMLARMEAKAEARHKELMADWKAWGEESRTTHEKIEPHPEVMQSILEHREVPVEDAPRIPAGEPKERRRDQGLAAERRRQKQRVCNGEIVGPTKNWPARRVEAARQEGNRRKTSRRATVARRWRNGVLERNWESVNGRCQVAQMLIPRSRVKEVLSELHGGPSGGHFGVNKTLNKVRQRFYWLQSDGTVERYVKTIEEHLRKIVASHQRDWDERLPLFLLAYRASIHDTTGLTPASLVFGRELRLPCDLLFGVPPGKELPVTDYAADLVEHLHDIHDYARKHLKLASDRMKTRYDKLANSAGYDEGDRMVVHIEYSVVESMSKRY